MLTAVAARDNVSSIVEVRKRPIDAIWRYHLDVIVDGERIYFDRYSQKIQQFRECVVYTQVTSLIRVHVIIMFASGAGVEVMENMGYLATRIYLPLSFANITRGLFGNWTFDPTDDFVLPDGSSGPVYETGDFDYVHNEFGMEWVLDDKESPDVGKSLFFHENFRSSNYYYDPNFEPEFKYHPDLSPNATTPMQDINQVCGDSYQCYFDYVVTLKRDFAVMTKYYQDQFVNIKGDGLQAVVSCGALPTPPNGRKSTFNFLSGAEVKFDCDPGYVLLGEQRRWCYASGDWNWPEDGEATCVSEAEYLTMTQGITAGTVLAVLLPILIALLCYASYIRSKGKGETWYAWTVPTETMTGGGGGGGIYGRLMRGKFNKNGGKSTVVVPAKTKTSSTSTTTPSRPYISRPITTIDDDPDDLLVVSEKPMLLKSADSEYKLKSEAPLGRSEKKSSGNVVVRPERSESEVSESGRGGYRSRDVCSMPEDDSTMMTKHPGTTTTTTTTTAAMTGRIWPNDAYSVGEGVTSSSTLSSSPSPSSSSSSSNLSLSDTSSFSYSKGHHHHQQQKQRHLRQDSDTTSSYSVYSKGHHRQEDSDTSSLSYSEGQHPHPSRSRRSPRAPRVSVDVLGCRPMRVPKHFDGDYNTNEPLDERPVVFPNVLWGVEDESYHKESDV
ncbi:hypothetical protein Pcinc_038000 [Petrolisthes cinctipes]|uniref:Sushi domain-containing protein n=1 Tax=Petrolisthes cinctipes TaxID=88211 RepID=A0AAE1BRI3_PETCI|nr:hypothetical protein Pcinc_038000 [Petrolisthes cinctipes]